MVLGWSWQSREETQRENYPGCLMTTEQLCPTSTEVLQPGYVQLCKPVNLLFKSLQPILVVVTCNSMDPATLPNVKAFILDHSLLLLSKLPETGCFYK